MPILADFQAQLEGDHISVPEAVAERLRASGVLGLRVRIEPASEDPALLAGRGIDPATIELVAATQKIDREIAAYVLAGEGIAHEGALGRRLRALVPPVEPSTE